MSISKLLGRIRDAVARLYEGRLLSAAVFGSVARKAATAESDIDLLIVADPLPAGRMARRREFSQAEKELEKFLAAAKSEGLPHELSPVFRTPDEARRLGTLFLDMTLERIVLADRHRFLERLLDDFAERLRKAGSKRVGFGKSAYWILVPRLRPGQDWSI